ncbi:MAG TPA: hypothetical protein VFZ65_04400 [Planctomycetota bacterium]|nr:hypothetical protein [Planctomycetota bacterium]
MPGKLHPGRRVVFALLVAVPLGCAPGQEPPAAAAAPKRRISRQACQEHLDAMRARIPAGFDAVLEPPFVVIGDGGRRAVATSATRTVRWAVDMLRQDFFEHDPDKVLEVWLFDGKDSYRKHTRQLFDEQPTTPYGFYSARHGALIMDIATGGGTLVHEIVHPFVEANVEHCPAWINEGLGSLFEQSEERDGRIAGLLNWRLDGLQGAIRDGTTIPIAELVATTQAQFYGEGSGRNYAMARYLLYWLQEHGKLHEFWRDWRRTQADDPTAAAALQRALGTEDLAAFQVQWEKWIAARRR